MTPMMLRKRMNTMRKILSLKKIE